jgi:uncharacterized protein GlcG (DUF336 family)
MLGMMRPCSPFNPLLCFPYSLATIHESLLFFSSLDRSEPPLEANGCILATAIIFEENTLMAQDLSLDAAEKVVSAAKAKAAELKTRMDITVVDAGGNLKAFARMDGAWLGSIDISMRKARTARWFDMNTGEIGKLSQPGGPLFGIEHSNGGLITFPGGVPLKDAKGEVVGAIGVSGSTVENDHAVAAAGAQALGK